MPSGSASMSEDENGESPHSSGANLDFWLSEGLSVDEIYDCLRTSKGKPLHEASKTSAEEVFKSVLAVLINKNAKQKVASRELEVASGELEVARHAIEKYRIENVRLLGENAGLQPTTRVLQGELEKAVRGAPVGLPGPTSKSSQVKSRSRSAKPTVQKKPKAQSKPDPEKKTSYLNGI